MRILGLLEDLMGTGLHRVKAPLDALSSCADHNVYLTHKIPLDMSPHDFDIIQCQRWMMPEYMPLWRQLVAMRNGPALVLDMDDDWFNVPETNPAYLFTKEVEFRDNLRETLSTADLITVSTDYLEGIYRSYNSNVVVLPNYLPQSVVKPLALNQKFALGWTGGHSHEADLDSVALAVNGFLQIEPKESIAIIGQDYTSKFSRAKWYPWEGYSEYINRIRNRISVGLAVVNSDTFNLGKSDIKMLEYAIAGAFPVYSDLPPYSEIHRIPGLGVDPRSTYPNNWTNALMWVYDNMKTVNEFMEFNYNKAKLLTHERNWVDRESAYREILISRS